MFGLVMVNLKIFSINFGIYDYFGLLKSLSNERNSFTEQPQSAKVLDHYDCMFDIWMCCAIS